MKSQPVSFSIRNLSSQQAKKLSFILFGVLFMLILIIGLFALMDGGKKHEVTTSSMDTYVQQTVYGKERETAAQTAANAVQDLDERASWDGADSDILLLNAQAGKEWITLSADIFSILQTAQSVAEKSGGAFDITYAPIFRLWDFENARSEVPDEALLTEMLGCVGYKNLRLGAADSSASLKYNGNAAELTQVLHGAACDTAVGIYKEKDVDAAIVSVGHSVGLYGKKPDGTLWNIAVPDPDGTGMLGTLTLREGFVSSVSVHENTFEQDGTVYHSFLDPRTGYPADSGLSAVTVFSESGTLSDALAAACTVLGREESLPLLEAYGAEAIFVDENNNISVTSGLQDAFSLTNENFIIE